MKVYEGIDAYLERPLKGKIVFTNGCFDILHEGHIFCLQESRSLGDKLIVGLNSDLSVQKLKGDQRPINSWLKRASALSVLDYVDAVIQFEEETPLILIKKLQPSIITKGGDYNRKEMIGRMEVEATGGSVIILPYLKGFSTTSILSKKS